MTLLVMKIDNAILFTLYRPMLGIIWSSHMLSQSEL